MRVTYLALLLQTAGDERLRAAVVLVRERDLADVALGPVGVDHDLVVALDEAVPLEIGRDALRHAEHVAVHGARRLALLGHDLVELLEAILEDLDNVGFELGEVVLDLIRISMGKS